MSALHGGHPLCRGRAANGGVPGYRPFSASAGRVAARTSAPARPIAAAAVIGPPAAASSQARAGAEAEASAPAALLQWAYSGWAGPNRDVDEDGGGAGSPGGRGGSSGPRRELRVAAAELGPGRGRGLVAAADVAPGETLLSVPLSRVFTSDPASELHWSAEMALRLLRARHAAGSQRQAVSSSYGGGGQVEAHDGSGGGEGAGDEAAAAAAAGTGGREASSSGGGGGEGEGAGPEELGEAGWGPWIRALPAAVRTPLEYGEEEIRQLGCPYVREEVVVMQQCIRDCYEVLQPQLEELRCGWEDFLWAVQVFHSRCFFESSAGLHMCVPGVDLANHSPQPSATVALQHSPGACQGYDALAEVAEPPPPEPSRFNLVAGEAGIRCGEEVTISYGRWPSEAFLLLFGFVPAAAAASGGGGGGSSGSGGGDVGPGECLTVFRDAEEAVRWCLMTAAQVVPGSSGGEEERLEAEVEAILRAVEDSMPGESFFNLAVAAEGVDGRLQGLLQVVSSQMGAVPRDLLVGRLRERLAHFDSLDGAISDEAIGLFVRSKRALALRALTYL